MNETDDEGWENVGDAHVEADQRCLERGEPADIVSAEEEEVIQPGQPLPEPRLPSAAEVAAHNCTHLPYRSWCPYCVAARRRNSPHFQSSPSQQRQIPLLVGDYCSIRDIEGEESKTILVCRLYPARALFATVCEAKGEDGFTIIQLARFLKDSGYRKVIYRSDQEPSIRALLEATFVRSQREGECYNPSLEQFVPEASAVGESQSNGKAEKRGTAFRGYGANQQGRSRGSHQMPHSHRLTGYGLDGMACYFHLQQACVQ